MQEHLCQENNVVYLNFHEVEFTDINHTLEWLIETVSRYGYTDALQKIEDAKDIIQQKRAVLFGSRL